MWVGSMAGLTRDVRRGREDASHTGFHIWLTERHPDEGPSPGWDIWADTAEDVDEWFADDLKPVRWL